MRCAYSDLCIYAGAKKKKKKRRLGAVCSAGTRKSYRREKTEELFRAPTLTNRLGSKRFVLHMDTNEAAGYRR